MDDIIARRTGKPILSLKERKRKRLEEVEDDEEEEEEDSDDDSDDEMEDDSEIEEDDEEGMEVDGFGTGANSDLEEGSDDDEDEEEDEMAGDEEEEEEDAQAQEADSDSDSEPEDTAAEKARKDAFFDDQSIVASASDPTLPSSFAQMSISRPLLRALTSLQLNQPTPIQAKSIPLALLGRDILGSAVTGSGKTAAFMIPILERLCYRDKSRAGAACRVLVLCPTRELAVQCEAVGISLIEKSGMDIRTALLVGGLSLSAQAHTLRTLPDILIATPGRLIDHINNSPSFTLSALDILVIDEADRMLEVGFEAELNEIIKACPRQRQTMLFSATMTDSVDELVKLSLNKPVRVFVDPKRSTSKNLTQEFVRVRERNAGGSDKGEDRVRAACLLALCKRTVKDRCIVFFRSKALAHQMRIVFGLCGLKAAELHGNLTQEQRLQALQDFKASTVDYLLATDLASRGLDIKGVETVINYDMPGQLSAYTHRVGRTARAGRKGRSITLVGEADRKMLKAAIKQSPSDQVRHRVIPSDVVLTMGEQLEKLRPEVSEVLQEEQEEKTLRQADMELRKGQNMLEHEDEIYGRPARTWFQSEKEKLRAKGELKYPTFLSWKFMLNKTLETDPSEFIYNSLPISSPPDASKAAYVGGFPADPKDKSKDDRAPIKRGKYEGLSRKQTRRKYAREMDEEVGDSGAVKASIRGAKKAARPTRITEAEPKKMTNKKRKRDSAGPKKKVGRGGFDADAGKRGASNEGMRAGRSDGVGLGGKSKSSGGKGKASAKKRKP